MALATTTLDNEKMTTTRNIVLDINKPNTVVYLAKQYDHMTRILRIRMVDNGDELDFYGKDLIFRGLCSNGAVIFNNVEIDEDDHHVAIVPLENSTLSVAGKTDCELQVIDRNTSQVLSSMTFIIQVRKSALTNEELMNAVKNEFSALLEAILLTYQMQDELSIMMERLQFMTDQDVEDIINGTFNVSGYGVDSTGAVVPVYNDVASATHSGLMSAADKKILDWLASHAISDDIYVEEE